MARLHKSSPWYIYVKELEQLFKYDNEVHVVYDDESQVVSLYVESATKADALAQLIPASVTFGNIELNINIIPANHMLGSTAIAGKPYSVLFTNAFADNPILSFVKTITGIFSNNLTYIVFKNRVVQYFSDDLSDIYGQTSTLYQDIAKNIFTNLEGVFFCTDVEEPVYEGLGAPLGEWP